VGCYFIVKMFFWYFNVGDALRNKKIVQPTRHCNKHPRRQLANTLKTTFVSHCPQYILTTYISSHTEGITIYFKDCLKFGIFYCDGPNKNAHHKKIEFWGSP